MTEAKEKKEVTMAEVMQRLNALELWKNSMAAWKRKASANWKRFINRVDLTNKDGEVGSIRLGALIAVFVVCAAFVVIGATTVMWNHPGPEGGTVKFQDVTGVGSLEVIGGEGDDARIILDADEGDDTADTWTIESEATGNDLSILNGTTEVLNLTSAGNLQVDGSITSGGGDITLENGETIDNATDSKVRITFDDDAVNLGYLLLTSENAAASLADNDVIEIIAQAYDSATNVTDYGVIQFKLTDVTTATENSQIILRYTVSGTTTTGLTLGTDAGGTAACTIVPNVTLTGDIDIDGGDITCPADLLITPTGTEVHINGGLHVGGTDAVGDNNLKVDGTLAQVGAATFTADITANGNIQGDDSTVISNIATIATDNLISDGASLDIGDTSETIAINSSDWTIDTTGNMGNIGTIGADGLITASGGLTLSGTINIDSPVTATNITLDAGAKLIGTTSLTLGSGTETVSIDSSDWDIDTSGNASGLGTIAANGLITASGGLTLSGTINIDSPMTVTNITVDASSVVNVGGSDLTNAVIKGSSIGSVNPSTGAFTTISASGDITANGNIVGDNDTTISQVSNVTLVAGAEATIDGKYAVVGPDATTGLMVLGGTATLNAAGVYTQTWGTAFGAAPYVTFDYTEDPGANNTNYVTNLGTTTGVFHGTASKGIVYIAVGQRP